MLPDAALPNQSLGRASNGNFVLSGVELEIQVPGVSKPTVAVFTRAEADYEQKGWEVAQIVRDQPKPAKGKAAAKAAKNKSGWAVDGNDPTKRLPRKALFVCAPLVVPADATLPVRLVHASQYTHPNIGRFRLSTTSLPSATSDDRRRRKCPMASARRCTPSRRDARRRRRASSQNSSARTAIIRTQGRGCGDGGEEGDRGFPRHVLHHDDLQGTRQAAPAFLLKRGEYDKPGDPAQRAVPAALPPLPPGVPNDRLGFRQVARLRRASADSACG